MSLGFQTLFLCVLIDSSFHVFEARPSNAFDKIARIDAHFKENLKRGHEVDMILPQKNNPGVGQLHNAVVKLWPAGVVPYTISQELKRQKGFLDILMGAMNEWQQKTCIQFKPRTTEGNYVHFISGNGCQADVGVQNHGKQTISLGRLCDSHDIIIHELGHTIGLYHEQNRPDRNNYIQILWDNILPAYHFAYRIKNGWNPESIKTAYDYYSVMHYGNKDFSKDGVKVTMKAYNPEITSFGGKQVSGLDAVKVRKMYKCKEYPRFPQDFYWTYNNYGTSGMTCILINEPRDYRNGWNDNKLCYKSHGKRPLKIVWSHRGPIAKMSCEKISYPGKSSDTSWNDNYLCLPKYAPFKLKWRNGNIPSSERKNCLKINEPRDRTIANHYLCAIERETDKIDGKWLLWSEWSNCSLPCGGGVQYRERTCTQPSNGGKFCVGDSKQSRNCNTQQCNVLPSFPGDFSFQHLPPFTIPEKGICLRTYDLYNYYQTRDYYFCTAENKINTGMKWSVWKPLKGMRCTKIYNPREYIGWTKNYLCVPRSSPYRFKWSVNGPIPNMACLRWYAKGGRNGWDKTYLCNDHQKSIHAMN